MTGVKGFIRDSIPPHWEKALKDHKCLGSFIEQFYQAIAKPKNKNKYHYKVTIMNARHYMKCYSIGTIAIIFEFKEGTAFWQEIDQKVKTCELNWK